MESLIESVLSIPEAISGGFSPPIVWGLFTRLLGLVYLIALASLHHQILPIAGAEGINPIALQLGRIRRDYPSIKRFLYFPTLLWINAGDRFLRALTGAGVCAAVLVIYGGAATWWALLACWLIYLSFAQACGLAYPWDCLLLEAGFLALFLPSLAPLPAIAATEAPLPAVGWAYRWLLFRLVLGFGKFKFIGTNRKEFGFLKGFLVGMPLPNPLGWHMQRLPDAVFRLGLIALFIVEIPTPFLIFVGGEARLFAALAIASLMLVIHLTGNWGFFNLLALVLCVPLLDLEGSIFNQPMAGLFAPWDHLLTHLVVLVLFIGGLIYFPFNSWCTQAWIYWPALLRVRIYWLDRLLAFYRALAPLRLIHAYGVFPPQSGPTAKFVPIIEGTRDGREWRPYHYRFMISDERTAPAFVAPYHPRIDHNVLYDAFGMDVSNFLHSSFGVGNPYYFSRSSGLDRLVQRLLEGHATVLRLFRHNPFPDGPPAMVRVNLYMFRPTSPSERARTGAWWDRCYLGPHLAPTGLDRRVWDEWLPEPELFHWDEMFWKRRAPALQTLMEAARGGSDLDALLEDAEAGITRRDVRLFWERLIGGASEAERRDWSEMRAVASRIKSQFEARDWRTCERILGRLSLALYVRLEPYYFGEREGRLALPSFFHLGMLIHQIIGAGRETCAEVYRHPATAAGFVDVLRPETGLFLSAVFWPEKLSFHASKFRLLQKYYEVKYQPGVPGFLSLIPFLAEQFKEPEAERYPAFARRISDGAWFLVGEDEDDDRRRSFETVESLPAQ